MLAPRATQAARSIIRGSIQARSISTPIPKAAFSTSNHAAQPASKLTRRSTFDQEQRSTEPASTASINRKQHFNTTTTLQASLDQSTIDFFYLPDIDHQEDAASQLIRVPILPDNYDPPRTGAHAPEAEIVVHKPEINTMSGDSVYTPMAELHDGHAIGVDFHAIADRVATNLNNLKVPVEEQASLMKQLWNDMVDDLFGLSKKAATS